MRRHRRNYINMICQQCTKEYEPKQSFAVIIAESGILEEQLSPLKEKV